MVGVKMMTIPQPLIPGDRVALVAPSGAVLPERIVPAIKAVEAMGFPVVTGAGVTKRLRYLAGDDDTRARDINSMFARKEVHGIFCMRGGFGASRILELLDYEMIKRNPKCFAGYSDITMLHTVLNQRCGLVTFHTPMAATEFYHGADRYTHDMFIHAVMGKFRGLVENPPGRKIKTLHGRLCSGKLAGGNLTSLAAGIGTSYEIDTTGKILFLEEVNEPPYKIDRLLTQLRLSGKLKAAAGIVFGSFLDCGDEQELLEIWREILPIGKPSIYGLAAGHGMPSASLALGANYILNAERGVLACMEP